MTDLAPAPDFGFALSPQAFFSSLEAPPPSMDELQELAAVMKSSLTMLGHTFDTLGEQTAHVAALPNVVENAHQVSTCQSRTVLQLPQSKHLRSSPNYGSKSPLQTDDTKIGSKT